MALVLRMSKINMPTLLTCTTGTLERLRTMAQGGQNLSVRRSPARLVNGWWYANTGCTTVARHKNIVLSRARTLFVKGKNNN